MLFRHGDVRLLKSAGETYLLDEPEVVADEHHATVELVDGLGQRVDGLDVQVIGGLVQEQHVGVLPGQPGEAHSALLAVRQVLDGADLSVATVDRNFSLL